MKFKYLKTNKIISKRYLAKPKSNSHYGGKYFRTLGEATNYLNKYNNCNCKVVDWKLIGKILYRARSSNEYKKYSLEHLNKLPV